MNPTEVIIESIGETAASRTLGPEVATLLQALMQEALALPVLSGAVEFLRRDSPASELVWRVVTNVARPSRLVGRRTLPAGVTPRILDETFEEAMDEARRRVMAATPAAAPAGTRTAAAGTPGTTTTVIKQVGEWLQAGAVLLPLVVMYFGPRIVGMILFIHLILGAWLWGFLNGVQRQVVAFGVESWWWDTLRVSACVAIFAPLIAFLVELLITRFRGFVTALAWATSWALVSVPIAAWLTALGLGGFHLVATNAGVQPEALTHLRMCSDWLLFGALSVMALQAGVVSGAILLADYGADAVAGVVGKAVPLERLAGWLWGKYFTFVVMTITVYLAMTRWPNPAMALATIIALPLITFLLTILGQTGITTGPWRKRLMVLFVAVIALTSFWSTLCVLYPAAAAALVGSPQLASDALQTHQSLLVRAWYAIVSEWRADQAGDWLTDRFRRGALWLIFGLITLGIVNALFERKDWSRVWAYPLGLAGLLGIVVPSAFHVIAIIFSWVT